MSFELTTCTLRKYRSNQLSYFGKLSYFTLNALVCDTLLAMDILTGVDLTYLPRFKKALKNGGENFLRSVYLQSELENDDIQHLAGIFAAKEAVMKALSLPTGSWHDIGITYKQNGAPKAELLHQRIKIHTQSLSITHQGNYVLAQFVAILK